MLKYFYHILFSNLSAQPTENASPETMKRDEEIIEAMLSGPMGLPPVVSRTRMAVEVPAVTIPRVERDHLARNTRILRERSCISS